MTATLQQALAALREGAAVARPGQRAVVAVTGPDAPDWLDRLSSAPAKDLGSGRCRWATLMDGKGKMRADLRLIRAAGAARADGGNDEWLVEIPASHAAALLRVLDMYILRDKVALQDRSASHAFLALLGPQAGAVLAAAGLPRPEAGGEGGADGLVATDAATGALVLPSRLYGADGYDLLAPDAACEPLRARLVAAGAVAVEPAALDFARIEHGRPWFAQDLAEGVIPLEAGLDAHVSITKGCYPGQEVVARISNLGQVARRLVRLVAEWTGDAPPALRRGPLVATAASGPAEAGTLTSFAHDASARRSVALGFVRRAYWKPGTELLADGVPLRVVGDARG